jgi:hypothetical protein
MVVVEIEWREAGHWRVVIVKLEHFFIFSFSSY